VKSRALHHALAYCNIKCACRLLLSGASARLISLDDTPALHFALQGSPDEALHKTNDDVLQLVKMLVIAGADVNGTFTVEMEVDSIEVNVLTAAVYYGRSKTVSYLLAKGADITSKDENCWTALHYAVASGIPETVETLLKAEGAVNQIKWGVSLDTDDFEWTTLDIIGMHRDYGNCYVHVHPSDSSLSRDFLKIIKLLVNNGADLDAKNELGNTPLHSACLIAKGYNTPAGRSLNKTLPIISAFLHAGANPNSRNNLGQTPLHVLLMEVIEAIRGFDEEELFPVTDDGLKALAQRDFSVSLCSILRVFVEAGAELDQRDVLEQTPLHALINGVKESQQNLSKNSCLSKLFEWYRIAPLVVELVKCGARSWEVLLEPCIGLEQALFAVWTQGNVDNMCCLFAKLEPRVKEHLRACLLLFNRRLPGSAELQMQILAEALRVDILYD
jgi:ankyrin repeat protein